MTGSSRFASDTQSLQEKVRQIRLDAQEKQRWWCWSLCYTSESSKETCRAPALSRVICKSLQKRWLGCLYKTKETNGLKTIGGEEGGIPESSSAPAACLKRIISLFNVGVGFFLLFLLTPAALVSSVSCLFWPGSGEMQWGWMTASHLKYTFHEPGDLWTCVLDVSYDP